MEYIEFSVKENGINIVVKVGTLESSQYSRANGITWLLSLTVKDTSPNLDWYEAANSMKETKYWLVSS